MIGNSLLQIVVFLVLLVGLSFPLGHFMARVFQGERTWLTPIVEPIERLIFHLCTINSKHEMNWREYTLAMFCFNVVGLFFVYALQRLQAWLPLNPQNLSAPSSDLSFNTAVSFVTNTNWQSYSGETTLSYLTQMLGLTVQNFVSAASGMALLVALIRGFARRSAATLGNFWVDLTRSVLYILLPLSSV